MNTYWEGHGKYEEQVKALNEAMPSIGYTDNVNMNLFIAMSHLYYDAYNNGGGNIEDCYTKDFHLYVEPVTPFVDLEDFAECRFSKMEKQMDRVLAYLKGKNISYTVYTVWDNYDEKKVSRTKQTGPGWAPITFGSEEERDAWFSDRVRLNKEFRN